MATAEELRMLEWIYHLILGGFAVVGAALWGKYVLSKKWHLAGKAIGLTVAASGLLSGWMLLTGVPSDLRILTEIFGTAGAVFTASKLVTAKGNKKSPWIQYGLPLTIVFFLGITWAEQIGKLATGQYTMPVNPTGTTASSSQGAPKPLDCTKIAEAFRPDRCKN
ncbi:MAG: hypothetical protein HQ488_02290 [Parcubacteria group bacterium]|nr:hypothetical protein [Parcubacteria group bacterium]